MVDGKPKIYIVDNEIEICHLFKDFFDFMEYSSAFETVGKKFLSEIESLDYDVLFLDLRLDDISGIEILKKSKVVHPLSEVIVVTGFGSDETVMSSLYFGALSYIQKPISFSEIKVQTELALAKKRYNTLTNDILSLVSEKDRKMQRHFQDIINLDKFTNFLNLSIDIDSLADSILHGSHELIPSAFCSLLFIDEVNREIVIFSPEPVKRSTMKAIENQLVSSYETLMNKKLERSYDVRVSHLTNISESNDDETKELNLKSIFVPILIDNSIQGILSISNKNEPFKPDSRDLLQLISQRASLILTNATLHRDTKLLALTDGLTGLLNHRAFHDRLVGEFERHRRYGSAISIIIADFDDLKVINDTFGHPVGDKVLRKIGDILREASRESDVLARYGGDEFVILLPQTSTKNACNMAERIRKKVKDSDFEIKGHKVKSSMTMGIASVPHLEINSPDELFGSADRALYEAKRSGKNRVRVFDTPL